MKKLSWLRRFWGKLLIITIVESGLPKDEIRISGKKLYISREAIKEIIKESGGSIK